MTLTGLENRVAIVTGAARKRSLGRTIALSLAAAGCDVVVTATSRAPSHFPAEEQAVGWLGLESVAAEITALGRRCLTAVTDSIDEQTAQSVVDRTLDGLGRVDILVNNAAASRGSDRVPVVDVDVDVWRNVIDVNLNGSFLMSRSFARALLQQGTEGSIVNISSIGGKLMAGGTAAYSASKAGMQAMTSAMAQELGPAGVRVNAICPGIVLTSRMDDQSEAHWAHVRQLIPLRRFGTEQDVANLAVFLCSEQAAWVTGQAWNVDGGFLTVR